MPRHHPTDVQLGMNWKERERMAALRRRIDHLKVRIDEYHPDGNPSHDRAELSAIRWAVRIIEEHYGGEEV